MPHVLLLLVRTHGLVILPLLVAKTFRFRDEPSILFFRSCIYTIICSNKDNNKNYNNSNKIILIITAAINVNSTKPDKKTNNNDFNSRLFGTLQDSCTQRSGMNVEGAQRM